MTYLLFQMALYMLVALILGLILGWYLFGKLFAEGNALGVLGHHEDEADTLRKRVDMLTEENKVLNQSNARLKSELDECRASKAKAPSAPKAAPAAAPAPAAAGAQSKPQAMSGPRSGGADDLKTIKGIGPKLEKMLHGMGIYHFDQIASWGSSELAWVDENLEGFKGRASRDAWVPQAKKLV